MSVARVKQTLRRKTTFAWNELVTGISKMAADCEVRPANWAGVFSLDEADDRSMKVEIKPVVFRLKERANSTSAQMFVTVTGKVNFSITSEMDNLKACYFHTDVGYFRINGPNLDHVLGIHYDFDRDTPAHPIFHAQVTSCMASHLPFINTQFRTSYGAGKDRMDQVAGKIRMPTAHMDPLAVFVQLLADHLMNENSNANTLSAFERARDALMFFTSDPDHSKRLNTALDQRCLRGPRWYPLPTPKVAPAGPLPAPVTI